MSAVESWMEFVPPHVHTKFRFKDIQRLFATICREQVVPTGVIGGIAIVIEWILLILLILAWSEVENEICPLMVPEVWTPKLGKKM